MHNVRRIANLPFERNATMRIRSLLLCAASVAVLAMTVFAAEEVKLDGIKCVMNPKAAAKAASSVDYKGGKVYFCCDNCPKKFDADEECRRRRIINSLPPSKRSKPSARFPANPASRNTK